MTSLFSSMEAISAVTEQHSHPTLHSKSAIQSKEEKKTLRNWLRFNYNKQQCNYIIEISLRLQLTRQTLSVSQVFLNVIRRLTRPFSNRSCGPSENFWGFNSRTLSVKWDTVRLLLFSLKAILFHHSFRMAPCSYCQIYCHIVNS